MESRPDPDELLKHIQVDEPTRGQLKIFLGYAAGVGKTYAMLEAAHQRRSEGVDVVIGIVETHGGKIDVRSTPGEGTTFTVRLPVKQPEDKAGRV